MRRVIPKGGDFACDLPACWECALRSSFLDHLQIKAPTEYIGHLGSSRQADLDWTSLRGHDCCGRVLHLGPQHLEGV